jgi:hypothetical protein
VIFGTFRMTVYCGSVRGLLKAFFLEALVIACALPIPAAAICITVEAEEPDRVVASLPLEAGEVFHLQFINSIYLEPVKETYQYTPPEGITAILVESPSAGVFEYYGLVPDGSGVSRVNTRAKEIRVRSHDYRNHRLSTKTRGLSLKGLVPDGEPLIIRIREGERCGHPTTEPEGVR